MKRMIVLSLIVLALFVIEGTLFQVFAPELFGASAVFVPRFAVIVIVTLGIFYGRMTGIFYGICFGLLYDVIYTEILGIYMFSFGLIGYIFSLSYRPIQNSYFFHFLVCIGSVIFLEYFLYGLLYLFEISTMTAGQFFYERFLSTVGLNFVFALIFLYPLRKLIFYYQKKEDPMAM